MPLPFIIGAVAAVAGVTGVGSGISGAVKMKGAKDSMDAAEFLHKRNMEKFEEKSDSTNKKMDILGKLELEILKEFEIFSDTIEKIQNRPQFKEYRKNGVTLPKYDREELKSVSVGAGVLLGGLGGAAVGTAGGFAAAGATASAVMALGTASTGTAIASLSGVAATNATLAALGGGALTAGGGGMALGSAVLGGATLGIGLLVGGIIFNSTGGKLSEKASEAFDEVMKEKKTIDTICNYLEELENAADKYVVSLKKVHEKYLENFSCIFDAVNKLQKKDWVEFTDKEKTATQNSVLLVGLLYKMCQISLVNKAENENEMNTVNQSEIDETIRNSEEVLDNVA